MNSLYYFLLLPSLAFLSLQGLSYSINQNLTGEKVTRTFFQFLGLSSLVFGSFVALSYIQGTATLFGLAPLNFTPIRGFVFLTSSILYSIVAHFSCNYLHKDQGFSKFFLNYNIFWLGLFFFIFGDDILVLFGGWELIGVSSIFLIGYYTYRPAPIFNSLFVVSFYKFADIVLITSLLLFNHDDILVAHQSYVPFLYMGIITAGLIKSGSFPFTPWLPKAMEGPTTSSAIFYGALSVNTGILLIVFYLDKILLVPEAKNYLLGAGILTVLYSSFQSRVQNNAKSLLAYSSSIQMGFVLIELSFGWTTFALFHLYANSFYKVYQFIKSPSMLHSFHERVGENQSPFRVNGVHFQKLIPKKIRYYLYYQNLHHFQLNSLYDALGVLSYKLSHFAEKIFFPFINKEKSTSFWSLMWVGYYIVLTFFINNRAIEIHQEYFDIIPFFILLVSLSMIHQKRTSSFIALMMIYKILESFILHGVHSHEPYKVVGVLSLTLFIFLMIAFEKNESFFGIRKKKMAPIIIFFMLYFTNFPFLMQSLVNDHIIEAFLTGDMLMDLGFYCLANTFFNIGLYQFIFNKVYLEEKTQENTYA
jgi:NADH:ubiquinone oxidoreductase subunit 2 (subunit N)